MSTDESLYVYRCSCGREHLPSVLRETGGCPFDGRPARPRPPKRPSAAEQEDLARFGRVSAQWAREALENAHEDDERKRQVAMGLAVVHELAAQSREREDAAREAVLTEGLEVVHRQRDGQRAFDEHHQRQLLRRLQRRLG
jgi:hypothetical protein